MIDLKGDDSEGKSLQVQCAECDRTTNHHVERAVVQTRSYGDGYDSPHVVEQSVFQIIRCLGCDTVSFRRSDTNSEEYEMGSNGESVNPETETLYPARDSEPLVNSNYLVGDVHRIPNGIQPVYREIVEGSRRGMWILVGVGIRTIVEAVCLDLKMPKDKLNLMIDALEEGSRISSDEARILHSIRLLGNDAAHELKAPTREQVRAALRVVDHLLLGVYVLPQDASVLPVATEKESKRVAMSPLSPNAPDHTPESSK